MGRNNDRNIKKHNDDLNRERKKITNQKLARSKKLAEITRKYISDKDRKEDS
ncbi:MAG: hypothetical protein ITG00_04710 [Flavobacterium sp.]|nr:hypothetical protein [Flavobacterium sp.]